MLVLFEGGVRLVGLRAVQARGTNAAPSPGVSNSVRTGLSMWITVKYLVGDTAGIREFCPPDTLTLFSRH